MMISNRLFKVLIALAGLIGQSCLGIYYSGALVPGQLITGNLSASQLGDLVAHHQSAIFLDAYFQGIGTLLTVIFFVGLVYSSGATSRFSGLMVIIASSIVLAAALGDITFTLEAAKAAAIKHYQTMQTAFDFVAGPSEAFDYTFLFVPAPLLSISLGIVLIRSTILPHFLGYASITIGVMFVVVGLISIFNSFIGAIPVAFEIVQLGHVMWVLASAIFILVRRGK